MTIDVSGPSAHPEGTTLPPPRPFGENSTLTLPLRASAGERHGAVMTMLERGSEPGAFRVAVSRVEPVVLTLTF